MKTNVTSNKTMETTARKKAAASEKKVGAPDKKAVAVETKTATLTAEAAVAAAPRTVATQKKKQAISILPESTQSTAANAISTEEIARRAYQLWEEGGYAHGRHEEHWLEAKRLLESQSP